MDEVVGEPGFGIGLRPVLITSYRRSTVVDSQTGWRATIDREVRTEDIGGRAANLGDRVVVETKTVRAATAVDRWLWAHHERPRRISKFAVGTAALQPELPDNRWHRVISRHVVTT